MGMVGLRDMFVVAPAPSCNHHHHPHDSIHLADDPINGPSPNSSATALGVGVGVGVNVIPLLSAAPCLAPQNTDDQELLNNGRNKFSGIQFWENQASNTGHYNNIKRTATTSILDHHNNSSVNLLQTASSTGGAGGSLSGPVTCQDCGNQAKKDCSHRRCRTCCKSRRFDCATHVKSTWVPAARRRERQLMTAAVAGEGGAAAGSSGSTSGPKKPRLVGSQTTTTSHTSPSNTTPPRSFDTSSSHQDASFKDNLPGQVRVPAVFRCVRVTAVDDGEDEFAYQAAVKIGGHVFRGFLYDQGAETRDGFPNLSELHLGGSSSSGGAGGRNVVGGASSSPIFDPSSVAYGSSGGWLLGGSSYGNPIN